MKVFLGGTCNESNWRDTIIPLLEEADCFYFDPVVVNWDEKAKAIERKERKTCDFCLYTITPRMKGVYSIAEVIDDSNKRPKKTLFCISKYDKDDNGKLISFDEQELYSLNEVAKMVERNGGKSFNTLQAVVDYLNEEHKKRNRFA